MSTSSSSTDRSAQNLADNPDNQYFVRSLIDLAKKFDLKTIAEWVETPEDAEFLREWGVDYLQGNLFGHASLVLPWPADRSARDFAIQPPERPANFTAPLGDDNQIELVKTEEAAAPDSSASDEGFSHLRDAIAALNAEFGPKPD